MSRLTLIAALAACVSSAASAQSSLGVTGIEVDLGGFTSQGGGTSFQGDVTLDVAITEYHGLQGDLAWVETGNGAVGRIAAHAYMTPRSGQKYGLFAMMGDVNGRSVTYGAIGIEGLFELSENAGLGGFTGLALGSEDGLDAIFAGLDASYYASNSIRLDAGLQVTEYDEAGFQAIGTEASLSLRYAPEGQPFALTAGLVHDMLTGPDGAPSETRAEVSLSWRFGTINSSLPTTKPLRTGDPVMPLIRRGLY